MQFQGKLINQTWENGKKNLVSDPILAHLAQIQAAKIFWKNLSWLVTEYHGQLWSSIISEKLMIQFWENLVTDGRMDGRTDGRTDGATDGQTDEIDFIERFPTNFERSKINKKIFHK